MAGGKGRQGHVRDRIGRGLEGHGKELLSTRLQGAELLLLKSEKVLARKAPGAFLSTEYFCRSWGRQCARLLKCSALCRPLLSYRCFEAPLRQKTVRVLLTGCGQFVAAGWVIGRSLQRFFTLSWSGQGGWPRVLQGAEADSSSTPGFPHSPVQ